MIFSAGHDAGTMHGSSEKLVKLKFSLEKVFNKSGKSGRKW